jgi:hypothetical protein
MGGTPLNRPLTAARVATAVAAFICPTRRPAVPYPYPQWFVYNLHNTPAAVGHTDYAGCVGDTDEAATSGPLTFGPDTGGGGPLPNDFHNATQTGGDDMPSNIEWLAVRPGYYCANGGYSTAGLITTGVFAVHTPKTMASISDGASNTYLVGEKCCDPDHYLDGGDNGDNKGWDFGFIFGNVRWSGTLTGWNPVTGAADPLYAPLQDTLGTMASVSQDTPNVPYYFCFGSAHAYSFNMVFCDGSVHSINYSIDPETHHRLGNVADGLKIDAKAY